jgi:FkbH-like protein
MRPVGERSRFPFQAALQFSAGYSRSLIPIASIESAIDLTSEFLVQIEPSDEGGEVTLYFGLVDFACVDVPTQPTRDRSNGAAAEPRPGADTPGKAKVKHAKCVVWDLDNTLWAGTLIEDGIEKLQLNAHAANAIRKLDDRGILNSVASKNNPEDAIAALKHFGLLEYFLHPQVSWGPKSQAIAEIAARLNIGIDSLVFVDDQPFERAEVEAAHPSVRVVDSIALENFLDDPIFDVPVTEESRARRSMYREEIERSVALQHSNGDYLEFLRGCGMRLTIAALSEATVARVYELAQRTNQMNFSGNRYSLAAIEAMLTDETIDAYVLRASDRFGDYGIIGFCVVEKQGPLMRDLMFSCRIQSKHVDRACLAYLIQTYADGGQPRFEAIYNETAKNRPAAEVFWEFGFEKATSDGSHHRLVFDTARQGRPVQDVVTVIVEDEAR